MMINGDEENYRDMASAKQAASNQIKPQTLAQCIERAESLTRQSREISALAEAIACQFGAGSPPMKTSTLGDEVVRDTPSHIPDALMHHLRNLNGQLDETMNTLHRLAARIPL